MTNLGIELALHDREGPEPLKPDEDAHQENPRKSYVYAHLDSSEMVFYVGKGSRRRAWSKDRDPLWHRYVDKHLGGSYVVRILHDNLSSTEAEELEAEWIAQCSPSLVNWTNMGRETDFPALEKYHKLRDANRALIQQGKAIEKNDLEGAANLYFRAIEAIREYAFIDYEKGLIGQLLAEQAEELGRSGEIEALDRVTMCLIKLKRDAEAAQHADNYFAVYRRDLQLAASRRIAKRIEKVLARTKKLR